MLVILIKVVILSYISVTNLRSMESSMMTSKGQVVVPSRLRKKYGIKPGLKIAFIEHEDGVLLKPMDEAFFDQFVGMLKDTAPSKEEYLAWKKEEIEIEERDSNI
jgi:AbrB family looped-hinge helix DNA binding protein